LAQVLHVFGRGIFDFEGEYAYFGEQQDLVTLLDWVCAVLCSACHGHVTAVAL
jgi:hypothetical protein